MTTQFYKAPHAVQAGGIIYAAGEPFLWESTKVKVDGKEVETTPGDSWEKVPAKEALVMATSQESIPDDADLDALPVTVFTSPAYTLAQLATGAKYLLPDRLMAGTNERYVRLNYTVTGTAPTTGRITAGVVAARQTA